MGASEGRFGIVLTTAATDEHAARIADALVEGRLAACVNIVGPIRSVYRWKGEICRDDERLLIVKTTVARFEEVRQMIRAVHSYALPEVILLPIAEGDPGYLDWIASSVAALSPGGITPPRAPDRDPR